jgi:putative transcriptional regulator
MKITDQTTDDRVLNEIGARLGRLRLNLDLSQEALAKEAGISKRTLERLEAGEPTQTVNLIRVLRALGLGNQLDALVPEPTLSPLQRLDLEGKPRERASRSGREHPHEPWTWGDDG